jgi:PAS domain S-box-containing protein
VGVDRRTEGVSDRSEGRFQTLVENVRDYAIFMLDADGVITEWTEGARRVKGYAAEEVLGRHVSMLYAPDEVVAGEPERELAEAAEEGRSEREAWRVRMGRTLSWPCPGGRSDRRSKKGKGSSRGENWRYCSSQPAVCLTAR